MCIGGIYLYIYNLLLVFTTWRKKTTCVLKKLTKSRPKQIECCTLPIHYKHYRNKILWWSVNSFRV